MLHTEKLAFLSTLPENDFELLRQVSWDDQPGDGFTFVVTKIREDGDCELHGLNAQEPARFIGGDVGVEAGDVLFLPEISYVSQEDGPHIVDIEYGVAWRVLGTISDVSCLFAKTPKVDDNIL